MGKNGRILFDRPKPTAGCSANGRRRRRRRSLQNTDHFGVRKATLQIYCHKLMLRKQRRGKLGVF
jgi:hypothetical protein